MPFLDHPVLLALEAIAVRTARPLVRLWWVLTGLPRLGAVLLLVAGAGVTGLSGAATTVAVGPAATFGPAFLREPAVRGPLTVALTAGALVYVASFVVRVARHADQRRDGDTLHPIEVQARVARAVLVGATVVQAAAGLRGGAVAGLTTTAMVALLALALGATGGEPPSGRSVRDVVRARVRGRTPVPVPTT